MSRSRKRTPVDGVTCAESEKDDKRRAHRRTRRHVRVLLDAGVEDLPDRRETENVWTFAKDGKIWWGVARALEMPKMMRK